MKDRWTVGEKFGDRYEVEHIFQGGMGTVYIVNDSRSRERYAVKSPREDRISAPGALQRFIREAEIWMGLDEHPNIVKAMFVDWTTSSKPLLFLEYVDGAADLRTRMNSPIDLAEAIDVAIQFCKGMQYAYEKAGMVHRDVKPENVLITPEGLIKVTDFGLAKTIKASAADVGGLEEPQDHDAKAVGLTRRGAIFGTLPYMSLEQLQGRDDVGQASDIYSFGVMFYELITGRLPFNIAVPASGTPQERAQQYLETLIDKQTNERPARPSTLRPGIPPRLDDLIMSCLENHPRARYADFGGIVTILISTFNQVMGQRGEHLDNMQGALINKGAAADGEGRYEDAIIIYDSVLKLNSRNGLAWHNKANSLMNLAGRQMEKASAIPAERGWLKSLWSKVRKDARPPQSTDPFESAFQTYGRAIRCGDRSLEIDPNYDLAWNTRGGCLLAMGRFDRALQSFDRSLQINPQYVAAWYNRGTCLRRQGKHAEALQSYEEALRLNPKHANSWNGKGVCLGEGGNYVAALECFDRALALNPRLAQARSNKEIWGRLAAGDKSFAVTVAPFANDFSDYFQKTLSGEPENPKQSGVPGSKVRPPRDQTARDLTDKAWGLKNLGRYGEALQLVDQAIALDPNFSTAYLQQGRIFRNMGRLDDAIASFDKALVIDPDYALVWLNKGLTLADKRQYENAIQLYERFIAAEANDPAGWLNKGIALFHQGFHAQAIECYEQALRIDPREMRAWLNKAASYLASGNAEQAYADCEKALELEPMGEGPLMLKGKLLMQMNRTQEALSIFDRLIKIYPQNAAAWAEKANCLVFRRERPDVILECCHKAASLGYPDQYRLKFSMGRGLYEARRYQEAAEIFGQLISEHPNDKVLWIQRAVCFVQPDLWREAADCYVEALRLDPKATDSTAEHASSAFQQGYPDVCDEVELADQLLQTGDCDGALAKYQQARNSCPKWWEIWERMGAALMVAGRFEEAIEQFTLALSVCVSEKSLTSLGVSQLNLGQLQEAIESLDQALELDPNVALAWYCKGSALQSLNRIAEAKRCYERASRLDSKLDNPLAV